MTVTRFFNNLFLKPTYSYVSINPQIKTLKLQGNKDTTYKHQLFDHPLYSKVLPFVVNGMFWCSGSNRLQIKEF